MKIQHWAIIFLIIIVPFSIVCRSVINKKILNLKDETRYNNIIDNASYDATAQIRELTDNDVTKFGKTVAITEAVADAAVDRFFNTLCVNFNLPLGREKAEAYFDRYIPAIIIIGYDGLYVYSCENVNGEYKFTFKPKIPYAETITYKKEGIQHYCLINYTLDNYVKLYFPDEVFAESSSVSMTASGKTYTDVKHLYATITEDLSTNEFEGKGTRQLCGYVGIDVDKNYNGRSDFCETGLHKASELYQDPNCDPFQILSSVSLYSISLKDYISNQFASLQTDNDLSYFLFEWTCSQEIENDYIRPDDINDVKGFRFLIDDYQCNAHHQFKDYFLEDVNDSPNKIANLKFSDVNKDYVFNDNGEVKDDASIFHKKRREAIINTITSVMREEFNEHNNYAKTLGVTYNFNIPAISRDKWNNTIDDVTVLAFMQGMPMGTDSYYNNYSLGGARIVHASSIYGEIVSNVTNAGDTNSHKIYHKSFCKCLAGGDTSADLTNNYYEVVRLPSGVIATDLNVDVDGKLHATDDIMTEYQSNKSSPTISKWFRVKYESNVMGAAYDSSSKKYYREKDTTGIVDVFADENDAEAAGFHACTECH